MNSFKIFLFIYFSAFLSPNIFSGSMEDNLLRGVLNGSLSEVKNAIDTGADVNFSVDEYGQTALHLAVKRGRFDIVKFLVEKGADPQQRTARGSTALSFAKTLPNLSIYEYLGEAAKLKKSPTLFGVSVEQLKAIVKAQNIKALKVHFLQRKGEGGRIQTLILLGETHGMTKEDGSIAVEIIRYSKYIGRETEDLKSYQKFLIYPAALALLPFYPLGLAGNVFAKYEHPGPMGIARGWRNEGIIEPTIDLEKNHSSDVYEIIEFCNLSFCMAFPMNLLMSLAHGVYSGDYTYSLGLTYAAGGFVLYNVLGRKIIASPSYRWYEGGIYQARDKTMAGSIEKFFDENDEMTAIFGKGHIKGVLLYMLQAGFYEIPIENIKQALVSREQE